ncbi:DUF6152 family protein [Hydrogenophaga palleronii]|uniref:DUF6152 family protein n=1 Tax=Hydrogenophaga palleronii TaxID=65655 RepID=UPI000A717C7F|nr:DUF6152 family protein [Hydrogenophaga palleronii]
MQRRNLLRVGALLSMGGWRGAALAHHGWSSFDQTRPIYLEGRASNVRWRNPHAELVLELPDNLVLPPDLAQRPLPPRRPPASTAWRCSQRRCCPRAASAAGRSSWRRCCA